MVKTKSVKMSEEIINKLKAVVSDLESIRDKHRLDFSAADKYEGLPEDTILKKVKSPLNLNMYLINIIIYINHDS